MEKARTDGVHPIEYTLTVMRDESEPLERRDAMAIAAAPYVHARRRRITSIVAQVCGDVT